MTHEIDFTDDYSSGDSLTIVYAVVSDDIADLSSVSASWWLLPDRPGAGASDSELDTDALLSDADSDVSVSVDGPNSEITVAIDEGATERLDGYQYQVLRARGDQGRETWGGGFPIRRP